MDDGEMEAVSRHMTHSSSTSEAYYRDKHSLSRSLKGFELVQSVTTPTDTLPSFSMTVYEHFKADIESQKTPTLANCRLFLKQTGFQKTAKQVQDKYRNLK